jgi:hypothetical protein
MRSDGHIIHVDQLIGDITLYQIKVRGFVYKGSPFVFEATVLVEQQYEPSQGYGHSPEFTDFYNIYRGELFESSGRCVAKNVRYSRDEAVVTDGR